MQSRCPLGSPDLLLLPYRKCHSSPPEPRSPCHPGSVTFPAEGGQLPRTRAGTLCCGCLLVLGHGKGKVAAWRRTPTRADARVSAARPPCLPRAHAPLQAWSPAFSVHLLVARSQSVRTLIS